MLPRAGSMLPRAGSMCGRPRDGRLLLLLSHAGLASGWATAPLATRSRSMSTALTRPCGAALVPHRLAVFARRHPSVGMALKTGIVGLPNVGKSTLFNALMQESQAQAANFPFCTIEPNVGVVAVPDARLQTLSTISKSQKTVPTSLSFVDIAGLVAGASKGEGLGNQFLANIRECDAIVHVVRLLGRLT